MPRALNVLTLVCTLMTSGPQALAITRSGANGTESVTSMSSRPGSIPSLDETVQRFIHSIRDGSSPFELLEFWSDDGVTFGVDADPISKEQYREQIKKRGYAFCFLFDSVCLRRYDAILRKRSGKHSRGAVLYSYRDLLKMAKTVTPRVVQGKEARVLTGELKIRIENGDNLKGNEQTDLEFAFVLEKETWKLTSVRYN